VEQAAAEGGERQKEEVVSCKQRVATIGAISKSRSIRPNTHASAKAANICIRQQWSGACYTGFCTCREWIRRSGSTLTHTSIRLQLLHDSFTLSEKNLQYTYSCTMFELVMTSFMLRSTATECLADSKDVPRLSVH
jgi:hypothetical protein